MCYEKDSIIIYIGIYDDVSKFTDCHHEGF